MGALGAVVDDAAAAAGRGPLPPASAPAPAAAAVATEEAGREEVCFSNCCNAAEAAVEYPADSLDGC